MKNDKEMKLILTIDYKKYWNINRIFSNPNIHFIVSIGGRGIGKTTSCKIYVGNRYLKYNEEFVYLRRYKDEIKASKNLFDDVYSNVEAKGFGVEGAFEYTVNDKRIGYGCALSIQHKLKSGVDFSKVTTLVFDEFTISRGGNKRYLKNEIEELFELISTIFRTRTNYKIILLGNNGDLFNPIFEYFKIPIFKDKYVDTAKGLYCEYCLNNPNLIESEKETPLYKLTKDTTYFDYHYNNKVLVHSEARIGMKNKNAVLLYRLIYNTATLNIYLNDNKNIYCEYRDKIIKDDDSIIIMESNKPNYFYIKEYRPSGYYKLVRRSYYNGEIIYNDNKAKSILELIIEILE